MELLIAYLKQFEEIQEIFQGIKNKTAQLYGHEGCDGRKEFSNESGGVTFASGYKMHPMNFAFEQDSGTFAHPTLWKIKQNMKMELNVWIFTKLDVKDGKFFSSKRIKLNRLSVYDYHLELLKLIIQTSEILSPLYIDDREVSPYTYRQQSSRLN